MLQCPQAIRDRNLCPAFLYCLVYFLNALKPYSARSVRAIDIQHVNRPKELRLIDRYTQCLVMITSDCIQLLGMTKN